MTRWMESQIETRARFDAKMTERAYAELAASVSSLDSVPQFTIDDIEQIDGAAIACLNRIGVEPGAVPESVKDVNERLDWLCRPSGTMRRAIRLEKGWHKQSFGAILGKLDTGESIALLPRGVRGYCYQEPGSGRKVKVTNEVAEHIEENAVLFYRPLPAKPLKARDLILFILRAFDRNDYLLVLAAALGATLVGLAPAWANQVAFGVVAPSGQANLILPIAALLLGVAVSSSLIAACRNLVMARISTKVGIISEAATFARTLALPTSFFKQYSSGDLANRIISVKMLVNQATSILLGAGLTSLLALVYVVQIGVYAPALVLPALVIIIVQAIITLAGTLLASRYESATMEASTKLSGEVTAVLNGIQKIKLAGAEDRVFAKWAHGYSAYARPAYNRPALAVATPALVTLVGLLGGAAIYYLADTASVSIPNYMAFNVAYGQVTAAFMALAGIAEQVALIGPLFELISPVIEATPEIAEDKPSVEALTGGVEVAGVSFRYGENQPYVLRDLSFKVRSGEYVAIVGKSGCGKSTILRLLLGFEQPERGAIFYGPHDVGKVDLRSLRQHIGVVMQDGKLFMGNIESNITISTPTATLDDAWEAAEIAGIADDIRKMPMGMQTIMTEGGGSVSGGQRQRIMIARAVCGKRRILLLDEATSALDNVTQKHVSDSLEKLNCTRIVVAHRLSTVRHCDRILVIDGGRVVEEGTYEELIALGGVFTELVERQRLDAEG